MSALALAAVLQLASNPACVAPGVSPYLAAAIVEQESGGDPLVLHDDDAAESVHPASADDAERIVRQRWSLGRSVGVGLAQITARSERQFQSKFGLTLRDALEPCANLRAGTRHWLRASAQIYNSGSPTGAPRYATSVEAIAARISGEPLPPVQPSQPAALPATPPCAPAWDQWALAACSSHAKPESTK